MKSHVFRQRQPGLERTPTSSAVMLSIEAVSNTVSLGEGVKVSNNTKSGKFVKTKQTNTAKLQQTKLKMMSAYVDLLVGLKSTGEI